jgi:hypothetical protein
MLVEDIRAAIAAVRAASYEPRSMVVVIPEREWKALPGSDRTKRLRKKRWDAWLRVHATPHP